MGSRRIEQVNELLLREINTWLARDYESPVGVLVTIEEVLVSRDLGHAKILISVLPPAKGRAVLKEFSLRKGEIRKHISDHVILKMTPDLHFFLDTREERAERMNRLLDAEP